MIDDPYSLASRAAGVLAERSGVDHHDVFVALGSGWSRAAGSLPGGLDVPMSELPGFPAPSVAGHGAALRSVTVGRLRILLALGRLHLYEGHSPATVVHGVRTAAAAGCGIVVLTNAAGTLRPEWPLGRPVLVADQINFTGSSPLTGPNPPTGIPGRFANMTGAYSVRLRDLARDVEPGLAEGVYMGFAGPQFETPAEVRAAGIWGADLVGMSTVHEAIAASHLGLEILGLSLVTNLAAGLGQVPLGVDEVFEVAEANAGYLGDLLRRIIERVAADAP